MAYVAWSVVYGEQPSAAKWNILGTNDAFFNAIQIPAILATATDGATVTFNLSTSRNQIVTLGGNRTLALSNVVTGSAFVIHLKQDGTGGRTVTWWAGITWVGGIAPTLTTGANKVDTFGFICTGAGAYYGYIIGQDI